MAASPHPGIVILGLPRSGTTLLRRLLDAHPNIACPGETFLLRATARFLESETIGEGIDYGVLGGLKAAGFAETEILDRLRGMAFGFLDDIAREKGKPRWAVKTAVDSFYIDEVEKLYGGHASFVCIVRHGLDAVLSLRDLCEVNQAYIHELHRYLIAHPRPFEAFAHAWADVTERLMAFAGRHPENGILCRYEDLVDAPEETVGRIFAFLGEPWDRDIFRDALSNREVSGLGDWKTYGKASIDRGSVGRWQAMPETWVHGLAGIVNPTLRACGYAPVEEAEPLGPDEAMRRYELSIMFDTMKANPDTKT